MVGFIPCSHSLHEDQPRRGQPPPDRRGHDVPQRADQEDKQRRPPRHGHGEPRGGEDALALDLPLHGVVVRQGEAVEEGLDPLLQRAEPGAAVGEGGQHLRLWGRGVVCQSLISW